MESVDRTIRPVIRILARKLARRFGVDVVRPRPTLCDLLKRHRIGTVLDVGANVGQFGLGLRAWGFQGRIISFEPVADAYSALARQTARDANWSALQVALSDRDGEDVLRVSPDSVFSSLRVMGAPLRRRFPAAEAAREQTIRTRRLDSLWPELSVGSDRVLLKSDTQGYEREVLLGARNALDSVYGVQLEASVEPLYEGEATMTELLELMEELGFVLSGIEAGTHDPESQRLLQADCLFLRRSAAPATTRAALVS